MKLKNKVAIVTGGARGIGEAIVRDYVKEGAKVVIADLLPTGEELAQELRNSGYDVYFKQTNVSKSDEVQSLINFTVEKFGGINVLCNNAAINIPGDVTELSEEIWDRTFEVNVKSQFLMSKYAIPHLKNSKGGAIVNMGSANSYMGEPRLTAYVSSKGAILMLTKSMALDFAKDNIRVNCICPGWVDTTLNDLHAELYGGREKVLEGLGDVQVIGRPIRPDEIAKTAVFLASDDASAITGIGMLVDGGLTAGF